MKQEKKSFRHESLQDAQSIEKILAAISESLGKGKLKFSDEEDEIIFQPEGLMKLKLTAGQDGNEQRFNIKVSWQLDSDKLKNKTIKVEH
ncbi:MAG: amphi-Trp domain-containing protein [Methyloprofundus sp.]|nr:amphi-Trp domain-containing protein [Methyloprofundus sp.]MDT8424601.1 amphi-Trp domain-containing protein [Methyloprofundus sp.]